MIYFRIVMLAALLVIAAAEIGMLVAAYTMMAHADTLSDNDDDDGSARGFDI